MINMWTHLRRRTESNLWCELKQAKSPLFMDYQRNLANMWSRPLALTRAITFIKTPNKNCSASGHSLSLLCSLPAQLQRLKTLICLIWCFLSEVPENQGRRLCIVAARFVLLRQQRVVLRNSEDLKGWLAAEQPEKAWRQAQRFPVAAFATLS